MTASGGPDITAPTEGITHLGIDLVGSYFTDLAHLRDRILGARPADFHPATVAGRAEAWLRRHTVPSGVPSMQGAMAPTPQQFRALLVRAALAHDPDGAERVTFATELLALGTAVHDSVGPGRPSAPVPDRQLVLVGDLLLSRAVTHITRGGPELAWFIDHAFERLIVNQFYYSAVQESGRMASWEAATREGAGLLTYTAVRCCALMAGDDEDGADSAGRAATELAIAVQLCFDIDHLTRPVAGRAELNVLSAMALAVADRLEDTPADPAGDEFLARMSSRSIRLAACGRAHHFVERARAEMTRGHSRLGPVLSATASDVAKAVLRAGISPTVGAGSHQ